tara:strand:+ start:280 stop:468 length:189 start_codon:yes stop_codon:yes gene_type:complete
MDKYRPIKELTLALFVIVVIIMLLPRPERHEPHDPRPWRPKDIYLIYKMWTDEEYRNVNNEN